MVVLEVSNPFERSDSGVPLLIAFPINPAMNYDMIAGIGFLSVEFKAMLGDFDKCVVSVWSDYSQKNKPHRVSIQPIPKARWRVMFEFPHLFIDHQSEQADQRKSEA